MHRVHDPLIIGAHVKGTGASKGHGTCSKFTVSLEVQVDWITASDEKSMQSKAKAVFSLDLSVQPVQLVVTRQITEGLFKGYQIAADTPAVALDAFAKACESPDGLTQVVARHSINLSR